MAHNRILIALDVDDVCEAVLDRGLGMVDDDDTAIRVLHVLKPLSHDYALVTAPDANELAAEFEREIHAATQARLEELVGVRGAELTVEWGHPVAVIKEMAAEWVADLIVLGSHGKQGVALLGSTANGVMHGAPCNVLAVRI